MSSSTETSLSAVEKINLARCRLINETPFYGYLLNYFTTVGPREKRVKTMAVWIDRAGRPLLAYNPEFLDKLSVAQAQTILRHELEHILHLHPLRAMQFGKYACHNHTALNWAMDAVIHGHKSCPHLEGLAGDEFLEAASVFLPEELSCRTALEQLVRWLPRMSYAELGRVLEALLRGEKLHLHTDQDSVPLWFEGDPQAVLERLQDHAVWIDAPDEESYRIILRRVLKNAYEKAGRQGPSDLPRLLQTLDVPLIDWRQRLRNLIGRYLGGRRPTYARPNRRRPVFGVKGSSRHAKADILVMVDVSGSIRQEQLRMFFTELEAISYLLRIRLLSFDHRVEPINGENIHHYKRGDWRRLRLVGFGGTSYQNVFDWVNENDCWGQYNIVLTDGYAPWPEGYDGLPVLWCLTPDGHTEIPPLGDCVRMT